MNKKHLGGEIPVGIQAEVLRRPSTNLPELRQRAGAPLGEAQEMDPSFLQFLIQALKQGSMQPQPPLQPAPMRQGNIGHRG